MDRGITTAREVSFTERWCHSQKMKTGIKTKVCKALSVLGLDFGKGVESGWSPLSNEALNPMQGFSKSMSRQRFRSNGGMLHLDLGGYL